MIQVLIVGVRDVTALLPHRAAETDLYAAKKYGRNRVKAVQLGEHKTLPTPQALATADPAYTATPLA
ncbi:hypothetical protein ACS15_5590 [Ralstonia insidiosa]|uniref:Uncharacterized protein n=1 Tax=Ralstonia insidiosa TaxID=190721 RepID=A0AAC9BP51_9RALS|nr:hypothetical protein ACS15_5590 [Ralstonia insidiosa]EPX99495.1 hypothetical protein C404_02790 [Ralstonia sp. AU12-08]GAQ29295.1 hypothetical protein SAMD00023378_2978 [Ralstonia sp. NT80]